MIHKFTPDWGTHAPILIKLLDRTQGPILELGLGISSTPLLHALSFDQDRFLLSLENDPQFIEMFCRYRSELHQIELVDNWDSADLVAKWSVVLVDHKPEERRKQEIRRLANFAEYIVLHDSEPTNNSLYEYDQIYPLFKYRYDYTKTKVHTTILSNFHDLNFLYNPKS